MKSDKAKAPAPKRLQKPNIAVRVLALTVTAAPVLGALVLVVYRDTPVVLSLLPSPSPRDLSPSRMPSSS